MARLHKYSIDGFRLQLSPNNWRPATLFFEMHGALPWITHVEVRSEVGMFLGTVDRSNLALDTNDAMRRYISKHVNKWREISNGRPD